MKYIQPFDYKIDYPYEANIPYNNQTPFIQIQTSKKLLTGYAGKKIILLDTHLKHSRPIVLFSSYQKPEFSHIGILRQASKKIKGLRYEILYVCRNQYLCVGFISDKPISFVILTVDLNTKGYYEIQKITDILKGAVTNSEN